MYPKVLSKSLNVVDTSWNSSRLEWLFATEFAALISFIRFHLIQTIEVKHNLVMVWYVRDFYDCPEHMQVSNILHSVWTLTYISVNLVLLGFVLYSRDKNKMVREIIGQGKSKVFINTPDGCHPSSDTFFV